MNCSPAHNANLEFISLLFGIYYSTSTPVSLALYFSLSPGHSLPCNPLVITTWCSYWVFFPWMREIMEYLSLRFTHYGTIVAQTQTLGYQWQNLTFCGWILFHSVYVALFLYLFIWFWTPWLIPFLTFVNSTVINMERQFSILYNDIISFNITSSSGITRSFGSFSSLFFFFWDILFWDYVKHTVLHSGSIKTCCSTTTARLDFFVAV